MAVKYLSGNRIWGTNAERLAMSPDATWSTPTNFTSSTSGQIAKSGGSGAGTTTSTAQSAQDEDFVQFTWKWVSGLSYAWVGISTLAYISAGSYDGSSIKYGFELNNTNSSVNIRVDGSTAVTVSHSVDTDTVFKLSYDGSDLTWLIDDVVKHTLTVDLSSAGLQYLWFNTNRYDSNTTTISGTWGSTSAIELPNGTIFITSDTNVHYMWNGTDTWNEVA